MKSVQEYFQSIVEKFARKKSHKESLQLARILFEDLCGIRNISNNTNPELLKTVQIDEAVARILEGEPVQYVTGVAHFYGYDFEVDSQVLIPRPETEELVYTAISWIKSLNEQPVRILDIGTGSGCIAIVLRKKVPKSTIVAVDISEGALRIAKKNSEKQNVQILFKLMDFSDQSQWDRLGIFNLAVSNPPYVSDEERNLLSSQVLFEPATALFPPQNDVQFFYRQIFKFCEDHLEKGGCLLLELNEYHADQTLELAKHHVFLEDVSIIKDMQGKKRILRAFRSEKN